MRGWMTNLLLVFLFAAIAEGGCRVWERRGKDGGMARAFTVHNLLDLRRPFPLLPLAGLSHRATFLCREGDGPVSYFADRFGFHNPDSAWEEQGALALLGDSFVQGHCVQEGQQLAALLEAGGRRILNLGLRGSGPLSQLGVMQEYALPQRPKRILWFLLANDFLYDLNRELRQPRLAAYFHGQKQSLMARQQEVNRLLSQLGAGRPPAADPELLHFPSLVTAALFGWFRPEPTRSIEEGRPADFRPSDMEVFAEILAKGNALAQAQGVPVDFIFIPDSWVFSRSEGAKVRKLVGLLRAKLAERGIELNDPTTNFDREGRPFRQFAAIDGYYGHFNPSGFRLLAGFVDGVLARGASRQIAQKNFSAAH
jgi:hypothetical protein